MKLRPRSLFVTAFLLIVISATLCFKSDNTDFVAAREIIVMRNIGHKILLSSGDTSSRVLPVNKTGDNQYHIRFASTLKFSSDSIVKIIRQAVETNNLPSDYIVNVVECHKNQVVYGFAILKSEQTNLVACKGRIQPKACYSIKITFRDTAFSTLNKDYFIGAGGGLTALMLIFSGLRISYREKRTAGRQVKPSLVASEIIAIGNYKFHRDKQYLEYNEENIELSVKESKLLYILSRKLNEVVERAELQKVWEDEGVIVGRSLDMFISKLRKKLENDSTVQLVNVHGKGYKLEINS
ncbi:MAG: response regulator transcription factor [Sphingobacteriaceae bacterium]|nr:response regulator transcription factor [Sphingobacteriaceae bacterium]